MKSPSKKATKLAKVHPVRLTPFQIDKVARGLELKQELSHDVACTTIKDWQEERIKYGGSGSPRPYGDLRSEIRKFQGSLLQACQAYRRLSRTALHEIAIDVERLPRFSDKKSRSSLAIFAMTAPSKGFDEIERLMSAVQALAQTTARTVTIYSTIGGRPWNIANNLLLLHLAELYEHLTGKRPVRKTKSYKDKMPGRPSGEFYDFVVPFWTAQNRTLRGLDGALKTWTTLRKKGASPSKLLQTMFQRVSRWQKPTS